MNILRRLIRNDSDITSAEYESLFSEMLEIRGNKAGLVALLAALSAKPFNINDILNFVRFLESSNPKKYLSSSDDVVNIVGTGGGELSTFNISTTAAFVAAAAGATVLKSGSHAYNSKCGSLDLLASLGVNINLDQDALEAMLNDVGVGFVNPTMYPPLLRRMAVSVLPMNLRDIGGFINTIGPLICPFHVKGQICGVRSFALVDQFAVAMQQLGIHNSISVWAEAGMDEFSSIGVNHFSRTLDPLVREIFDPRSLGLHNRDLGQLYGGSPEENIAILQAVLEHGRPKAARDTVAINAAFILLTGGKCETVEEGYNLSLDVIADGSALRLLDDAIACSRELHSCAVVDT